EALSRLAVLDSAVRLAHDSTFLRFRFLRAKALIGSGDDDAGCDLLYDIEGRLDQSARLADAGRFLITACRNREPA
ncbi:MAG: hypothetical protein ACREOK_00125, partial [Gemmatimonadaceae bacterium]